MNHWINRTLQEAITFVAAFGVQEHCHVKSIPKTVSSSWNVGSCKLEKFFIIHFLSFPSVIK